MKKQTKNLVFMLSIVIILVGSLVALAVLTKKQKTDAVGSDFTAYNASDYSDIKGLDVSDQPMLGKEKAPVTMVLFSDFSCPYCNVLDKTILPKIKSDLIDTGKAKLYFVNYSFINDSSYKAAVAGEYVYKHDPNHFYDFYRAVYDNQQSEQVQFWANETSLVKIAKDLKLDINYDELKETIKTYKLLPEVWKDRAMGDKIGVQGTPALLVNNQWMSPTDYDAFKQKVDEMSKEKSGTK